MEFRLTSETPPDALAEGKGGAQKRVYIHEYQVRVFSTYITPGCLLRRMFCFNLFESIPACQRTRTPPLMVPPERTSMVNGTWQIREIRFGSKGCATRWFEQLQCGFKASKVAKTTISWMKNVVYAQGLDNETARPTGSETLLKFNTCYSFVAINSHL